MAPVSIVPTLEPETCWLKLMLAEENASSRLASDVLITTPPPCGVTDVTVRIAVPSRNMIDPALREPTPPPVEENVYVDPKFDTLVSSDATVERAIFTVLDASVTLAVPFVTLSGSATPSGFPASPGTPPPLLPPLLPLEGPPPHPATAKVSSPATEIAAKTRRPDPLVRRLMVIPPAAS